MNSIVKYLFTFSLLLIIGYATVTFANDEKVIIKKDTLAQVSLVEGPHLIFNDSKTTLISAFAKAGQMSLKMEQLSAKPKHIKVTKMGEKPLSFTVPIKKQITTPPHTYAQPKKLFALSDVEGNFNTVIGLLQTHHVIDDTLLWTFGEGHLVIIGDVFDRGNHVTELLWLLYKLEGEAKSAGGNVHMLIGNHEMMNLQNDLRYVEPKYRTFDKLLSKETGLSYVDLFRQNTELGQWLRSRNIVEKIGDTLFTHGGISPVMSDSKLTLGQINKAMRAAIDIKKPDRSALEKVLFGRNGPMWYRGYFMPLPGSSGIDKQELTEVLQFYQAKAVAVGHTIVVKPKRFFDGRVIAVDVKHPADHLTTEPPRTSYGVLFNHKGIFVVDDHGGIEQI